MNRAKGSTMELAEDGLERGGQLLSGQKIKKAIDGVGKGWCGWKKETTDKANDKLGGKWKDREPMKEWMENGEDIEGRL